MSKLHEMTPMQRQFAEKHQNVVFLFLNQKGLPIDDYYDIVIFGYLQAVQEYDENPALSYFRFSTIARTKMSDCLNKHYSYENKPKRKAPTVSIHTYTRDGLALNEILPDRQKDLQMQTTDRLLAMEVLSCLTETEQQMVYLKADGLTCREIAEIFSTTVHGINGRFHRTMIENNRVSYIIDLETQYENGDTNFGGNNLTYRILQLLKLRTVQELGLMEKEPLVIGEPGEGKAAYGALRERYKTAEKWIPTRFKEYEEKGRDQYFLVKNNYYCLFFLAEQVKKQFFQKEFCYQIKISTKKEEGIFLDRWKLSLDREGRLLNLDKQVEFYVYLNEIEELLRPDVYRIMENFLDQKFEKGALAEYEMIKLTGQSCKSRLFLEALKQYVPGKRIQGTRQDAEGTELKMCCLEGALSYFMNCKLGYMKVNEKYRVGSLPYEIMAYTHEDQEKILIKSLDPKDHIGHISRFHIGNQLDLYLNSAQGKRLKTYYFIYDTSKFKETTQEEIDTLYAGTVIQEETDIILEGEMKFFVWISRERWGFVVLPVLRDKEQLYKGEETFFDFEDDTWELNYFDGRK